MSSASTSSSSSSSSSASSSQQLPSSLLTLEPTLTVRSFRSLIFLLRHALHFNPVYETADFVVLKYVPPPPPNAIVAAAAALVTPTLKLHLSLAACASTAHSQRCNETHVEGACMLDGPQLRLQVADIEHEWKRINQVEKEMNEQEQAKAKSSSASSAPTLIKFIHSNSKGIRETPWGTREFALSDTATGTCISLYVNKQQ